MTSPFKTIDERAVYHPINPNLKLIIRVLGAVVGIGLLVAIIICCAQASVNPSALFVAVNLLITALCLAIVGYLYRTDALDVDKFWFVIAICLVALYKLIVASVLVFNENIVSPRADTTIAPTTSAANGTSVTWRTVVSASTPKAKL